MLKKSVKHLGILAMAATFTAGLGMPQSASASEPFLGQIQMVGFNFAPRGWSTCDGQLLPINQNTALFSLLGTTFGGDGRTTFQLPDLRGRSAKHVGRGPGLTPVTWGQRGGAEGVSIGINNMPSHTHTATTDVTSTLNGNNSAGDSATPGANILASKNRTDIYLSTGTPDAAMHADSVVSTATTTVNPVGGGIPINVSDPYLGIYHVIAITGVYPSRN